MRDYLKIRFFKNSLAYSSTNIVVQFITMVREFAVRWILPPEIMGFWSLSVVVQRFVSIFDFGCIAGAARELPMIKGRKDADEEIKVRSTTLWFTLLQNCVVTILAVLYIVWHRSDYTEWGLTAACVGIVIFLVMSAQTVFTTFFTAIQDFVTLSKLLVLGAIIDGISFPISAHLWGLKGLMGAAIAGSCLKSAIFVFAGRGDGIRVKKRLSRGTLKELLSFGFFLRLVDYPNALFNMASILWVTRFMGIEALALFSMARSFFLQLADVSTRIGTVYTMHFLEQAGRGVPGEVMARQLKRFLLFQLLVVVPLLSWAAGTALPFIVRNFIPKYSAANQTFLILLVCGFFYVLNSGLTNPWVMEKKLVKRGKANTAGFVMMGGALFLSWFVLGARTMNGVAYATLAGYFLYFVYMVLAVGRDMWKVSDRAEIILSVTVSAGWTFFALKAGQASLGEYAGIVKDIKGTLFAAIWTGLAIAPVILYGIKRTEIFKRGRKKDATPPAAQGVAERECELCHEK